MSRMLLYFDKPRQPTGNETVTYPIYELDLQGLVDAGMVSWTLVGQITNAVNECYHVHGSVNNANVNKYLSTNIPHQQWQDGSILQARISKYVLNENNVYVPDPEYYDFEEIPIGQQPEDWGTASNYLKYVVSSNATIDGQTVTYRAYYNVRKVATWRSDIQYVRDKNRSMIRHFYTENGYSFGVYQGADCDGYNAAIGPVFNVAGDSQYSDNLSNPSSSYYTWSNPSGNGLYVGGNGVRVLAPWWSRTDTAADKGKMIAGREVSAATFFIFVHGVYNDKDYYGVLCIYPQDFSETATFKQIAFSLFTSEFWGDSIIAGGGGESVWGNDGPTSIPQGGNGSWNAPSNNHGDNTGQTAQEAGSIWGGNHSIFDIGYKKYLLGSPDATAFGEMTQHLSDPDTWQGFANKYYNPIQAVITCHMQPAQLAPPMATSGGQTVKSKITAATIELTTTTVPTFATLYSTYHVGSVSLAEYTGSFADYTNTAIYINLPYVGVKELDVAACMDGEVSVDYLIDHLTGDITAWVWVNDRFGNNNIRYEYKGNCAREIPLVQIVPRSTQVAEKVIGGIAQGATALAGGAIAGAVGASAASYGVSAALMSGGAEAARPLAAAALATQRNAVAQGAISAGTALASSATQAAMSGRMMTGSNANGGSVSSPVNTQCYLAISRPQWSAPSTYRKQFGYPSDISGIISETFHGFLSVRAIYIDNISATVDEKSEIEKLMFAGVYIDDNFGPEEE